MTVKELIERLSKEPDDAKVLVNGYEDGFDDINQIFMMQVGLNVNNKDDVPWSGIHEDAALCGSSETVEDVIILSRHE